MRPTGGRMVTVCVSRIAAFSLLTQLTVTVTGSDTFLAYRRPEVVMVATELSQSTDQTTDLFVA